MTVKAVMPINNGNQPPCRIFSEVAPKKAKSTATDFFQIPTNRVVELGTQIEL